MPMCHDERRTLNPAEHTRGHSEQTPEPIPGGTMSKRGRKKRDRKKSGANHGKRPNS
jgi:hypothetical protein